MVFTTEELHEQQHAEVLQEIHRDEAEAEEVSVRTSDINLGVGNVGEIFTFH